MGLQTIYNALRKGGLSRWGTLAVMGNLQAESGCEAVRVQGDFDPSRRVSKAYAAAVDSGEKTRNDFSFDGRGWGIYQLTFWSRKDGFYALCKSKGKSIGDEATQCEYLLTELQSYPSLLAYLKTTGENECYEATRRVCVEFERPAVNNVQVRYNYAVDLSRQVKDGEPDPTPTPTPTPTPPKETYWPPRMVDKSMKGPDVEVLQAILKARGYAINYIGGTFDDLLDQEVRKFQTASGLTADGVVGPNTWAKLLKT